MDKPKNGAVPEALAAPPFGVPRSWNRVNSEALSVPHAPVTFPLRNFPPASKKALVLTENSPPIGKVSCLRKHHWLATLPVTVWPSGDAVAVTTPVISPVFPSTPPHWRGAPLAEDAARPLGGFPLACACVVRPAVPFPQACACVPYASRFP